ncbi:MAG: response regulator transcription factor [Candidatus Eremiobacteraeota bacterium]|nr:response regulator transcription factor [Candidatus Eremiobacteraeota bacterium]MCW5872306.1 response regulator transcription factor [Candidatus Eremiobacteraeota bacterium]
MRKAVQVGVQAFVVKDATSEEVVAATLVARYRCLYLDSRVAPVFLRGGERDNRQSVVLECLRQGLSNQEIAERTNLSNSSVKAEMRALFHQYGVKDRNSLVKVLNLTL